MKQPRITCAIGVHKGQLTDELDQNLTVSEIFWLTGTNDRSYLYDCLLNDFAEPYPRRIGFVDLAPGDHNTEFLSAKR